MATKNDITGDSLTSKASNQKFRDNYDLIFKKKDLKEDEKKEKPTKQK